MKKKEEPKFKYNLSVRSKTISHPTDFQHKYHMSANNTDSIICGVPPQWRKQLARELKSVKSFICTDSHKPPHERMIAAAGSKNRRSRVQYLGIANPFSRDIPFINQIPADLALKIATTSPELILDNTPMSLNYGSFSFYCGCKITSDDSNEESVLFAVKQTDLTKSTQKNQLIDELKFHLNCDHTNIIPFVNAWLWEDNLYLVFKDEGDITLYELISTMFMNINAVLDRKRFKTSTIAYFCHEILKGLEFIHSKKFIHRDIKSDNILISSLGEVRISDFGACCFNEKGELLTTDHLVGSSYWMAPEMIKRMPYDYTIDIWSFGCVILELIDGAPPYFEMPSEKALEHLSLEQNIIPLCARNFGTMIEPFLQCCLARKRLQRASASILLMHPFLKDKCSSKDVVNIINDVSLKKII